MRTANGCGRLAQIINEMKNYGLTILGVSEMRWTSSGILVSDDTTVLFSGGQRRERGVGLLLNKDTAKGLCACVEYCTVFRPNNVLIQSALRTSSHCLSVIYSMLTRDITYCFAGIAYLRKNIDQQPAAPPVSWHVRCYCVMAARRREFVCCASKFELIQQFEEGLSSGQIKVSESMFNVVNFI